MSSGTTAASARSASAPCPISRRPAPRMKPDFADAERREIVVQHEALGGFRGIQQLDALLVVLGAERRGDQRLRFAAREQRRSVRARQHADFALDLADLVELAAIRTAARPSASRRGRCVPSARRTASWLRPSALRGAPPSPSSCTRRRASSFPASRTSAVFIASFSSALNGRRDLIVQRLIDVRRRVLLLGLADLLHQLADARRDLLAAIVAELDGGQHFGFGRLLRAGFHHHDAAFGAGDDDVDLATPWFLRRWDSRPACRRPCRRARRPARAGTEYRRWPATRPRR